MKATPIDDAVAAIERSELIVFPTDTVYAIACRPNDPGATAGLFAAKHRSDALTLPVLGPSLDAVRGLGIWDDRAERLASALWPGALTIIVRRSPTSLRWDLGGERTTIGLRVPRHPLALALLGRTGPLAASSANRSGVAPGRTCAELHATFEDLVAIYLCDEATLDGLASTVIDLSGTPARIERAGGIAPGRLRELLGPATPLLDSPSRR